MHDIHDCINTRAWVGGTIDILYLHKYVLSMNGLYRPHISFIQVYMSFGTLCFDYRSSSSTSVQSTSEDAEEKKRKVDDKEVALKTNKIASLAAYSSSSSDEENND